MSVLAGCAGDAGDTSAVETVARSSPVTFSEHIAPLMIEHCADCHRPHASAPFSLLAFADVGKRAKQIVEVTESRFMPPWLPERGFAEFAHERRLSDEAIALIDRWVREGAREGDPALMPPLPDWPDGWQLGEPDLIVKMPRPYTLPADGPDVFRNFVIRIPVTEKKYVRAVELRPGNPRIVHHAVMLVDRSGFSRSRAAEDAESGFDGAAGFDGMEAVGAESPDGHFLGWTPGRTPSPGSDDMSWEVMPGTDLVLMLHMFCSGKPEEIQAQIGLLFAENPPTRTPVLLRIGSQTIDIPPGQNEYTIQDEYRLPVAVDLLTVYPHAHYLAKQIEGFAMLPDGEQRWLVSIPEWDFNWQDEYRFKKPISLPRGTTLKLKVTYDNSDQNIRNPHHPPRRVVYGPYSTDEMGDLWIQVVPRSPEDTETLQRDKGLRESKARLAGWKYAIEVNPDNFEAHYNLGVVADLRGKLDKAIDHYRHALTAKPDYIAARVNLGILLAKRGKLDEAADECRHAVQQRPESDLAHYNLGVILRQQKNFKSAIDHLREAIRIRANYADAYVELGITYWRLGEHDAALKHYAKAVELNPEVAAWHARLADMLAERDRLTAAETHARRAVELDPKLAAVHVSLGNVLHIQGKFSEAAQSYERAVTIRPESVAAHSNLAIVLAKLKRLDQAIDHFQRALEIVPNHPELLNRLGEALLEKGQVKQAIEHFRRALAVKPGHAEARRNLREALQRQSD